jgi:hypothetical protein
VTVHGGRRRRRILTGTTVGSRGRVGASDLAKRHAFVKGLQWRVQESSFSSSPRLSTHSSPALYFSGCRDGDEKRKARRRRTLEGEHDRLSREGRRFHRGEASCLPQGTVVVPSRLLTLLLPKVRRPSSTFPTTREEEEEEEEEDS